MLLYLDHRIMLHRFNSSSIKWETLWQGCERLQRGTRFQLRTNLLLRLLLPSQWIDRPAEEAEEEVAVNRVAGEEARRRREKEQSEVERERIEMKSDKMTRTRERMHRFRHHRFRRRVVYLGVSSRDHRN